MFLFIFIFIALFLLTNQIIVFLGFNLTSCMFSKSMISLYITFFDIYSYIKHHENDNIL